MDSADMSHNYDGYSKYCSIRPQTDSCLGCCLFRSFRCQLFCQLAPILRQKDSLRSSDGPNSAGAEHTRTATARGLIAASR